MTLTLSSFRFIIFFILVVVIYYTIDKRFQSVFLMLASFVFYLFGTPQYAVLLAATIGVNFYAGKLISRQEEGKGRKAVLTFFVVLNVIVLLGFKYYNFIGETLAPAMAAIGLRFELARWIAPLGISYYTLMSIDFLVSVYKRTLDMKEDVSGFVDYALYVSFFPQILAGPINRASRMLPQFQQPHEFNYGKTVEGMQRFLIGALKKVVLADGIAVITNRVFANMGQVEEGYTGFILIIAQFLYVLRMFGDFSGYTDMAVGAAKILGIDIMENFNAPYFSISVNEFWRRWHISLSSWLRDYIYIPLGGNRKGRLRKYFNSMVVYFVCGLWHEPSWNFAVWGVFQSVMVIIEDLTFFRKEKQKLISERPSRGVRFFRWLYTMTFFYLTLLFVSTENIRDVGYFFRNIFRIEPMSELINNLKDLSTNKISSDIPYLLLYWGGMLLAFLIIFWLESRIYKSGSAEKIDNNPIAELSLTGRWMLYFIAGLLVLFFYMIAGTNPAPPIYINM